MRERGERERERERERRERVEGGEKKENREWLASYPGSFEGAEKRAWSTLSVHEFNFSLFQESVTFLFMFVLCYAA